MESSHPNLKKDGISAVLIGKDESGLLHKTLPPLIKFADEVVFVDTGSTDNTPKIAIELGCNLYHFEWQNDFSTARNYGISLAQHKWILSIDCDEEIMLENNPRKLFDTIKDDNNTPAAIIIIDNLKPDGGEEKQEAMRLFLNDKRIYFSNPVHENVCDSVYKHWPNHPLPKLDIHLKHYGYLLKENRDDKFRRNIEIMADWVANNPTNIYACYKLGSNLYHLNKKPESLEILTHTFNLLNASENKESYAFIERFLKLYISALEEHHRHDLAEQVRLITNKW